MVKGDMNPVMYGILKMVEYKVQIITFSQVFHDSYTSLSGQLCKMSKSFNGQRYRCGIYCAFEDHLLVHLSCRQKSWIHQGSIFTFFDSLPKVKSNTVFGKISLMAFEKYSLEIEEIWFTSVSAWLDEQQQLHPIPESEKT